MTLFPINLPQQKDINTSLMLLPKFDITHFAKLTLTPPSHQTSLP
jgi:hypothetical protein